MNPFRAFAASFVLALAACALSHEAEPLPDPPDASVDLGPGELAPRCPMPSVSPCLAFESTDDREWLFPPPDEDEEPHFPFDPPVIAAVGTDIVNQLRVVAQPEDSALARWSYVRTTIGGSLIGDAVALSDAASNLVDAARWGALAVDGSSVLAAWREETADGLVTNVARIDGNVVARIGTLTHDEAVSGRGALALTRTLLVVAGKNGLSAHPIDRVDQVIPIDASEAIGGIVATDVEGGTLVVWSRPSPSSSLRASVHAALIRADNVERVVDVFDAERFDLLGTTDDYPVSLLVHGVDVWVARFSLDERDLRGSRVRIARLDRTLERIGPDRWFAGWNGVPPRIFQLIEWNDAPWILLNVIGSGDMADARYYAQPLSRDTACGYSIEDLPMAERFRYVPNIFYRVGAELLGLLQFRAGSSYVSDYARVTSCD